MYSALRSNSVLHNQTIREIGRKVLEWLTVLWLLLLALILTLPDLLISRNWHPYIVTCVFFLQLQYCWTQRKDRDLPQQLTLPLTLLLCWLPSALLTAPTQTVAWEISGYLLLGVTIYTTYNRHPWLRRRPILLTWLLFLLAVGLVVIAPSVVQWKSEFRLFYLPLYDLFTAIALNAFETLHANLLAGALVLLLPLVIAHLLPNQKPLHKLKVIDTVDGPKMLRFHQPRHSYQRLLTGALASLLVLMLALLLLTQSRGGYIAITVASSLLLLLRWPRLGYGAPLLIVGIGYIGYRFGGETIFALLGADNTFGGADWRGPVWHASWQAFQDFGWTGIGIGNFQQVMPLLYPNPAINNLAATHAHNLLLQIGLDLGLPGLAAYLTLYLTMVGMAIAVLRRTRSPQATANALGATWDGHVLHAPPEVGVTLSTKRFIRQMVHQERTRQQHWALAAGCLAALIGMQIHGFLDAVTWGNKLAFIPWLIFAQITLLYRYHTEQQESSEA